MEQKVQTHTVTPLTAGSLLSATDEDAGVHDVDDNDRCFSAVQSLVSHWYLHSPWTPQFTASARITRPSVLQFS